MTVRGRIEDHLPEPDPEQLRRARELSERAPVPARVGSIACGTAGWTDPTLIRSGSFYPSSARSAAERLGFYAHHFPLVEVDSTFYAIPAPTVSQSWIERTHQDFLFDIKAHPVITGHPIDRKRLPPPIAQALSNVAPDRSRLYPKDLPSDVRNQLVLDFQSFLRPLQQANRLGCLMVQLPPWITATRGAVRELETLPVRFPDVRIAIEFRHPSWLEQSRQDRVFAMLRSNSMAYVVVDEPDVKGGGVPPVVDATREDLAIVRFHGHNIGGWRKGATVIERFNYLYSPEQIAAWVRPVRVLAEKAAQVHAVFNNCVRDYAVLGAKDLAALLVTNSPGQDEVASPPQSC